MCVIFSFRGFRAIKSPENLEKHSLALAPTTIVLLHVIMSSELMDTGPGGETPQYAILQCRRLAAADYSVRYESIKTVTEQHSKQGGQLGGQFCLELSSTYSILTFSLEKLTQPDALTSLQQQQKAEGGEKTAENVRYGQTISEEGMGGKTTEAGGSANRGKSRSHVRFCNHSEVAEACVQMDSDQQIHKGEQTILKSPGVTRAMGQDLALGHRAFWWKI